jgi:malate synthase
MHRLMQRLGLLPPFLKKSWGTYEPENEALRRSKRVKKSAISTDYKVYNTEIVHMEGNPTSYEEAMGGTNSSKWLEAMEDEMRSMSSNNVWD